jgi:NADPH:quinone reductase-like Zn-dependent oxidoreductase
VAVDDSDVTHLPDGVDLADAAAIPLIELTGDQLVRLATNVQKGQVVLVTGALGSVGRAAVLTAKKIGAQVIAGVRGNELDAARSLCVSDVLAIDDDEAIEKFRLVDAIKGVQYSYTSGGATNVWEFPVGGGAPHQATNFTSGRIFDFEFAPVLMQTTVFSGKFAMLGWTTRPENTEDIRSQNNAPSSLE